uniref:DUF1127 domain-containing protein n=1 Tax=Pararhizobium sp. IMCC3301 TaxID=3067904 RepID=UPI002740A94B|nr:DUF1127 domain-containing protein [Pararhizobium sp. IMCC3301]
MLRLFKKYGFGPFVQISENRLAWHRLHRLDDRMLTDIGLSRAEVAALRCRSGAYDQIHQPL